MVFIISNSFQFTICRYFSSFLQRRKGCSRYPNDVQTPVLCGLQLICKVFRQSGPNWGCIFEEYSRIDDARMNEWYMEFFSRRHRHTRKKIRVLLSGVEPMTFRLLVWMLYHWGFEQGPAPTIVVECPNW